MYRSTDDGSNRMSKERMSHDWELVDKGSQRSDSSEFDFGWLYYQCRNCGLFKDVPPSSGQGNMYSKPYYWNSFISTKTEPTCESVRMSEALG